MPLGLTPMTLFLCSLSYDVEGVGELGLQPASWLGSTPSGPQTSWSGTAKSIVPRLQLFQKWLLRITLSLPPAIHIPTPTGTGTVGMTSEQFPPGEFADWPGTGRPGDWPAWHPGR